jgi:hypothetical protein
MAQKRSTTVHISTIAAENAECLLAEMMRYGVETSREKLMRALVSGVPAPQAAAIVSGYIMDTARDGREPSRAGAPGDGSVPVGEPPAADAADD